MKFLKLNKFRNHTFNYSSPLWLVLIILILSLLLSACSSTPNSPGNTSSPNAVAAPTTTPAVSNVNNPAKIDPCNLVTKTDIETVISAPVSNQKNSKQGPTVICSYSVTTDSLALHSVLVSVEIDPSSKSKFESMVKSAAITLDGELQAVTGIGDAAYSLSDSFLFVVKGNVSFNLYFPFGDKEPGTMEKAKTLAQKAVTRL